MLQHRIKQTMKDQRESKRNWISMNVKTIKWHASVNVMKNKEVSIIRIKSKIHRILAVIPFHRYQADTGNECNVGYSSRILR